MFAESILENGIPTTAFPGDWLGHGAYFWQGDDERAWEWAKSRVVPKYGGSPVVIQAVLDLRACLDLTLMSDRSLLEATARVVYDEMPTDERHKLTQTYRRRELDCKAINAVITKARNADGTPRYTTVRGAFREGFPVYSIRDGLASGIYDRDHIQINVVDKRAILSLEIL